MVNHDGLRTWIEIDTKALKHNFDLFRGIIPKDSKLCVVAKSNAYGHGLIDFSKTMESFGADMIAVDSVVEGLKLRKEGIKTPIFILGYTLPERVQDAVENSISMAVSTFELLDFIIKNDWKEKPKLHIKIDSGMGRQGFLPDQKEQVIKILKENKDKIEIEGVFTHFAAAKNPAFPSRTQKQFEVFTEWKDEFEKNGFDPLFHAAASSATLLFPEMHLDMVRIGISMYGEYPSLETEKAVGDKHQLKRALVWKTILGEVKKLPEGSRVGYDFTETLERDSVVSVCPVGYWHGYRRALSSIAHVMVGGTRCRVLGRVSMDMIEADVTDVQNPEVGMEVELIGENISPAYLAGLSDTSNYEILTTLNPLIKKFYI